MPRNMHVLLPTFAADYSGACSTLFELGGTVVVHDPSGCMGNFAAYDEPRAYDGGSRVFTTALDDVQALFGMDDALIEASCAAQQEVQGSFFVLVGTPNPMVLGTDYEAIAREVGRRCGIPAFSIDTTGTRYYGGGVSKALLAVCRELVEPLAPKPGVEKPGRVRVNLLGATPLDLSCQENVDDMRGVLESAGIEVVSCWAMGSDLGRMREGLGADCNVVLTTSALPLARHLRESRGIPYVWGSLSGRRAVEAFCDRLVAVAHGDGRACDPRPAEPPLPEGDGPRALVIADQVLAHGYRQALVLDAGFAHVDVATMFYAESLKGARFDRGEVGEDEVAALLRDGGYDVLVGDGLLGAFLDRPASGEKSRVPGAGGPCRLVEVPHVAVSSRISWDSPVRPYGDGFLDCVRGSGLPLDSRPPLCDESLPAGSAPVRAGRG